MGSAGETTQPAASTRVLTVPNLLSGLRLVGVPVFVWAILSRHDGLALVLLMASGLTDYLDGKIARRYNLVSRLGQVLDPIADRLYIAATIVCLALRTIIPWWLVALLVGRDLFMLGVVARGRRHGIPALPVTQIGKAATFNLLYAFPLLLLGVGTSTLASIAQPVGWAFAWWGTALYLIAAGLYAAQLPHYIAQAGPQVSS